MPDVPAPMVDAGEIQRLVGAAAYGRGRDYARAGAVLSSRWDPEARTLSGTVGGSGPQPYRCVVVIPAEAPAVGGKRRALSGTCSCPIGFDCKHIAALLLASNELAVREMAAAQAVPGRLVPVPTVKPAVVPAVPPAPQSDWKRLLGAAV